MRGCAHTVSPVALALAVLALGALMHAQGALDCPQWRGLARDGAASGFIAPESWPDALTRRWFVPVGEGYATPLVIDNVVYLFSRQAETEVLTALDADSGAVRWRSAYPAPYSPSQAAAAHGAGPKATPLVHAGRIITHGISGIVSAFDAATGARLWQTPPPSEPPFFGAASSPMGEDDLVVVHPGNYEPLTAFDARTGDVESMAGSGGFFASPIAASVAGVRQIVSATQDSVIGVSLDGRVLWSYPWEGREGSTTPVLYNDTIIVGGGPRGLVALRPALRGGAWIVDGVWETRSVSMYLSNPIVIADTVFGLSTRNSGQYFAVDAATGMVLWLGPPRQAQNSAVVKAGDLLMLLNDDGELVVATASRTGVEPVARYRLAENATWAQPAVVGGRIFVKDATSLALWTLD